MADSKISDIVRKSEQHLAKRGLGLGRRSARIFDTGGMVTPENDWRTAGSAIRSSRGVKGAIPVAAGVDYSGSIAASEAMSQNADKGINELLNAADAQPVQRTSEEAPAATSGPRAAKPKTGGYVGSVQDDQLEHPQYMDPTAAAYTANVDTTAPEMPTISMPQMNTPVYDEGGTVNAAEGASAPRIFPVTPVMPRRASVREIVDSPETLQGIRDMYKRAGSSFDQSASRALAPPEILEPINREGSMGNTTEGERGLTSKGMSTKATVPTDALGIVHTHPFGTNPKPSKEDYDAAQKLDRPNYELSRDALYVAEPGGNKDNPTKVADIEIKKGIPNFKWNPKIAVPQPEKFTGYMEKGNDMSKPKVYDDGGVVKVLPDTPMPQPVEKPRKNSLTPVAATVKEPFWSPERKAKAAALGAETAGDLYTTHKMLEHQGVREADPLARPLVSKGLPGQVGAAVLGNLLPLGAEYLADKTGHPKISKMISRISPVIEGTNVARQFAELPKWESYPSIKDNSTAADTKRVGMKPMVYDEGGNVDVNDGQHQLAILQNGERVLTPEQAQTDAAKSIPMDSEEVPQKKGTPAEQQAVKVDKQQAMGSGNLVKLGTALLHERHLDSPNSEEHAEGTPAQAAAQFNTPATPQINEQPLGERTAPAGLKPMVMSPNPGNMVQTKAGAPLISEAAAGETPGERRDFSNMEYKAKLAGYDKQIQKALDEGTPEGKEEADRLSYAKQALQHNTPWGSENNHPGVGGKIAHIAAAIGNTAGNLVAPQLMSAIPGTAAYRANQARSTLGRINLDTPETTARMAQETKETPKEGTPEQQYIAAAKVLRTAQASGDPTKIKAAQDTLDDIHSAINAKDVADKTGTPEQQLIVANKELREAQASGDQGRITAAQNKVADISGATTKTAEKPAGVEGVKQYQEQLKAAGLRVPRGYEPTAPEILPTDTNETAKDKVKDYVTSVNNAVLAKKSDDAQTARENASETRERRAEDRKDRSTIGYAQDESGQTILTNKYDAGLNSQPFEQATPGDVNRDRQASRQLNDVQLNTSRYTKAARDYDAAKLSPEQQKKDTDNLAFVLNKSGFYDIEASISQGGNITLPVVTAAGEKASTLKKSEQYNALSPQAKALLNGYIRTMASVPAYQKALTGIGRSNKEMLDLELNNIANPTLGTTAILDKQGQFQENIDRATEGFPKLPGIKRASQVKNETEGEGTKGGSSPNTVTAPNGTLYTFKTQADADTFKKKAGL